MAIMFVCELATPKIRKELNKKGLRYDFWTLKATAALVWPLTVKAVLQNFNNGGQAFCTQNLSSIEPKTPEISFCL